METSQSTLQYDPTTSNISIFVRFGTSGSKGLEWFQWSNIMSGVFFKSRMKVHVLAHQYQTIYKENTMISTTLLH